jgi:hypothetical protein
VKKVDYYASQEPWKMPKWLGATVGGIFAFIAVGCAFVIMHLTKTDAPAAIAVAAAAPAAVAAPVEPAANEKAAVAAPSEPAAKVAVKEARESRRHGHHASAKASKKSRTTLAKHSPAISGGKASAILAKRDSKSTRKDKDALDKLLGL